MRKLVLIFIICLILLTFNTYAHGSVVKITGEAGKWQLEVDGRPFYIKGVGLGDYLTPENIDYLFSLTKALGANAIRRWGQSDYDDLMLTKALEYNLKVVMGYWLPIDTDYLEDDYTKEVLLERIKEYVNTYKNHPALLAWSIGNEVIILGKKDEEERIAFAKFLERVCQEIKNIDPNHPVIYAGAGPTALRYIKDYTPSLDIYGFNFYGGVPVAYYEWKASGAKIPYIFTEYGPGGPWEVTLDENDQPLEPTDQEKKSAYLRNWRNYISKYKGYNLGGFAFHLTELMIPESSITWWGLTYEGLKKSSYWAIYAAYTGKEPANRAPVILDFKIDKTKDLKPADVVHISTKASDIEGDVLNYEYKIFDLNTKDFLKRDFEFTWNGQNIQCKLPSKEGLYRIYVFVTDGKGNVATTNKSISIVE
jgi:hypothetical protein